MTAFGLPMWICLAYLFVLGTIVGSFLNVCIYRIPTKQGFGESLYAIISPPSSCPRCRRRIPGWCNIPVLGWVMLRGRCYYCKGWISLRYPLIEFFNGALFAVVYWMHVPDSFGGNLAESWAQGPFGPTGSPTSWWLSPVAIVHWRFLYHLVLLEALIVASFIDIDLRIIPDGSTLPAMAVGVFGSLIGKVYLAPVWHQNLLCTRELQFLMPGLPHWLFPHGPLPAWISQSPHWHGLSVSIAGLVVGGGLTWVMRLIGHWGLRREAIGFGDVILMALIGSFLGWQAAVMVFFIAPLVALVVTLVTWPFRRDQFIPYGPYLSLAALLVVLCWKPMWSNYERIFGCGPLLFAVGSIMLVMFAGITRLIYGAKVLLGLQEPAELTDDWTSGDHLFHFAGETVDPRTGRWPTDQWPGTDSSRGWTQYEAWRHAAPGGHRQHWMRRSR